MYRFGNASGSPLFLLKDVLTRLGRFSDNVASFRTKSGWVVNNPASQFSTVFQHCLSFKKRSWISLLFRDHKKELKGKTQCTSFNSFVKRNTGEVFQQGPLDSASCWFCRWPPHVYHTELQGQERVVLSHPHLSCFLRASGSSICAWSLLQLAVSTAQILSSTTLIPFSVFNCQRKQRRS